MLPNRLPIVIRPELWTPARSLLVSEWWCADDLPVGAVASWKGRRNAASLTLLQPTPLLQPICSLTALNNKAAVTADGVDDFLDCVGTGNLPTGATAGRIFVLYACGDSVGVKALLSYGGTSARRQIGITAAEHPQAFDGVTATAGAINIALGTHVMDGQWAGTVQNGWHDGAAFLGNPGTITTINTGTASVRMFSNTAASPGQFAPATIRHAIVTPDTLTTELIDKLRGYLAWDGGIASQLPATHPYRYEPPRV